MSLDQQFNIIHEKLQKLLKQYNRLQKENERLSTEIEKLTARDAENQQTIHELQQKVSILKVASGEMTERDKKEFEKKLNEYIKEVDRCINYLSE